MEPIHYEQNLSLFRKIAGANLEALWAEHVTPHMGDRLCGMTDTLRYDRVCRQVLTDLALSDKMSPDKVSVVLNDFQAMHNFWKSGKRIFMVSSALSEMLMETELKTAKFFLRLPYPCIYIRFEQPPFDIQCGNWMPLDGMYVMEMEEEILSHPEGVQAGQILIDPKHPIESTGREKRMKIVAISKNERPHLNDYSANMVFTSSRWNRADEEIIDESKIEKGWDVDRVEAAKKIFSETVIEQAMPIWRIALNVIAYINSVGSDVARMSSPADQIQEQVAREQGCQRPPKKLYRRAEGQSRLAYFRVGGRIQIPARRGAAEHVTTGRCRVLHYRHCVRGHFRHYHKLKINLTIEESHAVRADEGDRVKIIKWIAPYWRGPDAAEVINREYFVKKPD